MKTSSNKKIMPVFEAGIDFKDTVNVNNQLLIAKSNLYLLKVKITKTLIVLFTFLLLGRYVLYPNIFSELNNPLAIFIVFFYSGYLVFIFVFLFGYCSDFRNYLLIKDKLLQVILIHRKKTITYLFVTI